MEKQLEVLEKSKPVEYKDIEAVSEKLIKPVEPAIIYIPNFMSPAGATTKSNCKRLAALWKVWGFIGPKFTATTTCNLAIGGKAKPRSICLV